MFSKRLKELRKKSNLTQIEFAKKINVANGTVGNWESGNRQPDYETLNRIAEIFNVSVDYLLCRTDAPQMLSLDEQLDGEQFALHGEIHDLTDEEKAKVLEFIKFTKSQRKDN